MPASGNLTIDCAFPGGNILVDGIAGDEVRLRQDRRDTTTWWFYWYFRVTGAAGRQLRFSFADGQVIGVRGPAVSTDAGRTWRWLGAQCVEGDSFTHTFGPDDSEIRFCVAMPYLHADLAAFLGRQGDDSALVVDTLCTTRKGRPVEMLRLGRLDGDCACRALIACRHHCCEMMASHVLEGLMETVLSGGDDARWMRENVELLVIPFADKDGVEDGDQGKNRAPRDHNRDYEGESVHVETAALREFVPEWSGGKLRFALDIHCPTLRGEWNEHVYLLGQEPEEQWAALGEFSRILEDVNSGPIPYAAANNLPFGESWNTAGNYSQGKSFGRWAYELPEVVMAAGMEVPYANAAGAEVNPQVARAFGRDLATAVSRYLEGLAG